MSAVNGCLPVPVEAPSTIMDYQLITVPDPITPFSVHQILLYSSQCNVDIYLLLCFDQLAFTLSNMMYGDIMGYAWCECQNVHCGPFCIAV